MLGAIIGDIIGSRFEFDNIHTKDFELFGDGCHATDDSMMTFAIAESILSWRNGDDHSYKRLSEYAEKYMRSWAIRYPDGDYGIRFSMWVNDPSAKAYGSAGNGAAMRISPVGMSARTLEECIAMSHAVTEVTHNHPDGIKGAEATAVQIFLARHGSTMKDLQSYEDKYYYPLEITMEWLQRNYKWSSLCDMTCQPAYLSMYESDSYEDAVRNAISIGGDSDTLAAITGSIAEPYWKIPEDIKRKGLSYLNDEMLSLLKRFYESEAGASY